MQILFILIIDSGLMSRKYAAQLLSNHLLLKGLPNKQSSGQSPEVLNRKKLILNLNLNENHRFSNFPV